MTKPSQTAADNARNQRDKEAGIVKVNLRIQETDKPLFQKLAKESRELGLAKKLTQ